MLKTKIKVNFQSFINWFSACSVILLIVAFVLKIKTLIIAGELLILLSIIGMIFGIFYSILSKYDKTNK